MQQVQFSIKIFGFKSVIMKQAHYTIYCTASINLEKKLGSPEVETTGQRFTKFSTDYINYYRFVK